MLTLNTLLDLVCGRTKIHICIHDISGILRHERLQIDAKYCTHTKPVCNAAKSTPVGFDACIACKDASNRRAASGEDFSRRCPFGIYEIIRPAVIDGKVKCIIYLGNLSENVGDSKVRAEKTCNDLGIKSHDIIKELHNTELINSDDRDKSYYEKLADFIRDFITELYNSSDTESDNITEKRHWCVEKAEDYILKNYENSMTLSSVASLYFINEKYLGRIFKKQTGKTFHQYLTDVRLGHSIKLLAENHSVISVSHMCGFVNVTYFNRCFKEKYGISPGEYRKTK